MLSILAAADLFQQRVLVDGSGLGRWTIARCLEV
jgi:hypothetical protein